MQAVDSGFFFGGSSRRSHAPAKPIARSRTVSEPDVSAMHVAQCSQARPGLAGGTILWLRKG